MQNEASSPKGTPIAVVGAGAVGTALAERLTACGYPVQAVISRTAADARVLADRVGASVGTDEGTALPPSVEIIFLCVPDDAISTVSEALSTLDHPWDRTLVAHTSGARPAEALTALVEQGAAPFSFHPLQTFTTGTPPDAFEGISIGVEGSPEAVLVGKELAHHLGAHPIELSAQNKVQYHCAAALASNGLVALMAVVEEILASADVETDTTAASLVAPLVEQTWSNLTDAPPERVITGPVARADRDTVAAHLEALRDETPHLVPLYAALSTEMTRIAVRSGRLKGEDAEELLNLLRHGLENSTDGSNSPPLSH